MQPKIMHKFYRVIRDNAQFKLCNHRKCNYAENVAYRWEKVTCPDCLKKRPVVKTRAQQ